MFLTVAFRHWSFTFLANHPVHFYHHHSELFWKIFCLFTNNGFSILSHITLPHSCLHFNLISFHCLCHIPLNITKDLFQNPVWQRFRKATELFKTYPYKFHELIFVPLISYLRCAYPHSYEWKTHNFIQVRIQS